MQRHIVIALAGLMCLSACKSQRVAEPEMQKRTLLREVTVPATAEAESSAVQRKCDDDANQWFGETAAANAGGAILLDSWSLNDDPGGKCYAQVERIFRSEEGISWQHEVSFWSVTDNARMASLHEERYSPTVSSPNPASKVVTCDVNGVACATLAEFRSRTESYLPEK